MKMFKSLLVVLLFVGTCYCSFGQHFNLEPASYAGTTIGLKTSIPLIKNDEFDGITKFSGSYTISGLFNLKNNWSIYAELPLIVAKDEYDSESGLGNLMLVIRRALNDSKTSHISLGTYLPTAGKDNSLKQMIGARSNIYRLAHVVRAFTVYGNYAYNIPAERKGIFGVEVGPDIWFPVEEGDTEILLHAGGKAGHKFNKLWLWAEYNGILIVSEPDLDFKDRLISQIVLGGQLKLGKVNPGVFYVYSLEKNIREDQSGIVGFKIAVGI